MTRTVTRLYDQHLAVAGLKTTQYSLLMYVKHEALPVTRLAALLGVERTTLSRNLKPLLAAGWVTLQPGTDPRQRIVTISAAGGAKVRAARAAWRRAQAELEQTLGAEAVQALHGQIELSMARLAPLLEAGAP
ncbi:winged helix-turn-helix transcriptional regulator [Rugamonas sp. CCM 8940]|nr:winged helix-turn-helix transcriptional regulator [Rugamonas sp. CCM 8940]